MGKRSKVSDIILKNGDKLLIKFNNGKLMAGEVTGISQESVSAIVFETVNEQNFKVHHIEMTVQDVVPQKDQLSEVLTFTEAAEIWGLDPSTLRHRVAGEKLREGVDFKKSGKVWLITRNAMERLYGQIS